MKLLGVEYRGNYLYSEWNLTYRTGWSGICKAASLIFQYTKAPEVFIGDAENETEVNVKDAEELLSLEESGYLTIRGESEIIGVPIMITFYNQLDLVRVTVIPTTAEFEETDYKRFNLSMCQYMDSAELAMYM